jgi:hypothetical protein
MLSTEALLSGNSSENVSSIVAAVRVSKAAKGCSTAWVVAVSPRIPSASASLPPFEHDQARLQPEGAGAVEGDPPAGR